MDIAKELKRAKPHLAESSIKNYTIPIEKVCAAMDGQTSLDCLDKIRDTKKVLEYLKDFKPTTKRNYLNALVVMLQVDKDFEDTDAFKIYSEERDEINLKLKEESSSGEKTQKQKDNWLTPEEYDDILNKYELTLKKKKIFTAKSQDLDKGELRLLEEYILLKLYQQIPSRNDFATLRVVSQREYNKLKKSNTKENLLITSREGYYFIINSWKTKKKPEDKRRINVPISLQKLLKLLIHKKNTPEYLFHDTRGKPLSRNGLSKLFNTIFKKFYPEKKISTSMLRHMYLSNKYGKVVEDMKADAELLAHSTSTQKDYIKTDN